MLPQANRKRALLQFITMLEPLQTRIRQRPRIVDRRTFFLPHRNARECRLSSTIESAPADRRTCSRCWWVPQTGLQAAVGEDLGDDAVVDGIADGNERAAEDGRGHVLGSTITTSTVTTDGMGLCYCDHKLRKILHLQMQVSLRYRKAAVPRILPTRTTFPVRSSMSVANECHAEWYDPHSHS